MKSDIDDRKALCAALADATRLRVLKLLEGRELCVCRILPVVGGSAGGLSRHLAVLRRAGLLASRKDGRWVHYRLNFDAGEAAARQTLGLVAGWLNDDPRVQADRRALAADMERKPDAACRVP